MSSQKHIKINRPFFENLDALRFIAAFSVFSFHFFREFNAYFSHLSDSIFFKFFKIFISKGTFGVNFFFVLSGFLITFLILHEKKHKNSFNLYHFLIRRFLRIWPLYFFIIGLGFILFPLIFNDFNTKHNGLYYVFFLANFDEINNGLNDSINFLTAPWSVAVEEQFYLFWGVLLWGLYKIKFFNLKHLIGLLWLISLVFSYYYQSNTRILYYHTLSVMPNILAGALLGILYFEKNKWVFSKNNLSKTWIILIYSIGVLLILLKNKIFYGSFTFLEHTVTSIFFAFVIYDQIFLSHSFFKFGRIKLFNHLGQISYGLYLYHLVIMFLLSRFLIPTLIDINPNLNIIILFLLSSIITYIISRISYQLLEKPFLKLKSKFI